MAKNSFFKALQQYHPEKSAQVKLDKHQPKAEWSRPNWQERVLLSAGDFLINAGRKLQMRYESDVITPIQRVG